MATCWLVAAWAALEAAAWLEWKALDWAALRVLKYLSRR